MRQKKKLLARESENSETSENSKSIMNSKSMKFKMQKLKQSNVKASIIETTLEYELPTITDTMARTLQNEGMKMTPYCKLEIFHYNF